MPNAASGVTQFLTLEDEFGLVEGVIFSDAYRRVSRFVTTPGPFLVRALVEVRRGVPGLDVRALEPFAFRHPPLASAVGFEGKTGR